MVVTEIPSLLAGRNKAEVRTTPFPHIVVENALEEPLHAALSASFPGFERMGWACPPERMPNNKRYAMLAEAALAAPDMPDCWKSFVTRHTGRGFLAEVAALFAGHWPAPLLAAVGGCLTAPSSGLLSLSDPGPWFIHQDARLEINTPVRGVPSSSRGPHLDTPNRLFSGLYYLRAPDDDSVGGDLVLYRWRQGAERGVEAYEVSEEEVEPVLTIPYRANSFVIFPQSIDALHGVSPRHPTPHLRRYVFITAETAASWLSPGQARE